MSSSPLELAHPAAGEAPEVLEALVAFDQHFLGATEWNLEELLQDWQDADEGQNVWVARDAGRAVGYLELSDRGGVWSYDGYVHPAAFGRGVGSALAELGEQEVQRRGGTRVRTGVLGQDDAAHELMGARGYEVVRRFYRMRIELEQPPAPVEWPDGLALAPFDLTGDTRAVHAAVTEAFQDHWSPNAMSHEAWLEEQHDRGRTDAWNWIVVRDGEEIAAVTILDRERFNTGWIPTVATRRPWRRRGLGEAMLHEAFRRFWELGRRDVALGVDAQSETGATRLYERVGMHVTWSATFFEKDLP
jgi:mycothiol synthase